jgi:hypothetical protein
VNKISTVASCGVKQFKYCQSKGLLVLVVLCVLVLFVLVVLALLLLLVTLFCSGNLTTRGKRLP